MKMRKFTAILITLSMLLCIFPAAVNATVSNDRGQQGFRDVPGNHWAYDQIMWMIRNKIVEGDGKGNFYPNRDVTRDEFAKMMVLSLRLKLINPDASTFLDVRKDSWQHKYVETAKPYLTGYKSSEGYYFHPSEPAVREDMAVALVKALDFSDETADETLLAGFSDSGSISSNLRKYVAIAVKHDLMQGYDQDGKRLFGPKAALNRATAATLLYNAFKSNEEKITFDEEKVAIGDSETPVNTTPEAIDFNAPQVRAEIVNGRIKISWDRAAQTNFTYYKVVASKDDSTPAYPGSGYYQYITDRNCTYACIKAGDGYNGGDFGGRFEEGEHYYFSVTYVYGDRKIAGNAIRLEMP